ncbi:unnamed protein product [Fraxinus pennsylvanica]|uniref:Uncharacterized protein n=1 Tax=Fraxinus pennsylvanica TaxID=56036 RepID=A0AAD2A3U7_9LAMI|nr:unnamed protein product [Fraxinus pennsylvanica]
MQVVSDSGEANAVAIVNQEENHERDGKGGDSELRDFMGNTSWLVNSYMQNEARKANQTTMVAEEKIMEPPEESIGISKQKWLEERKKIIGRLFDANGLNMSKAYMLDTQDMAKSKYKKWEKEPTPADWDEKQGPIFRTCKNCKTQFDPVLNHPRACRYHTAHFGGETKRKFESVFSGGTMDTPDSGKVFQYWHCCGSEDPFDPGCTSAPHASYDD